MTTPAEIEPGQEIDRLKNLVADILNEAMREGATSAEAGASIGSGLSATVRMGNVETVEHNRDKGLGVTVYMQQKKGSASTTDFGWPAVQDTIRAACRIARHTAEDDCAGLADPELMARQMPELDLFHPWDVEPEQAIALALSCEQAARDTDPRITNSEGATVSRHEGSYVYGNTHGFMGDYSNTRHSISCAVISEQNARMQRDHWYSIARDPVELESPAAIGRRAAERALGRLGARQLSTRSVPVLFSAEIATTLFSHLINAIRGGNLYRKSSFLLDHLGKQVFPAHVRIHEQPHLRKALGSAPFDNEGVATAPRDLVANGVLAGYVLSSYSARKLNMKTTGNAGGVHNVTVEPGEHDFDGLLADMDTGLLVTELLGMGVNIVTGDYSRGAAGYWVEGGTIQHPVEEITIAGNLQSMFMGIRAIGTDVDTRGNTRTGSVLIDRLTVAGG